MDDKSLDTAKSAIKFFYELEQNGVPTDELIDVAIYLAVILGKNEGAQSPERLMLRMYYLWKKVDKMNWLLRLPRK